MKAKRTHTKSGKVSNSSGKDYKAPSLQSTEVEITDSNHADVSVFTKNRSPKVVIGSENLNNKYGDISHQNGCKHRLLKSLCLIVMCIIILMTFFLSLSTYNTVNKLSHLLGL